MESSPRYKIGTVASLLGVTPNVLRAWERRYQFTTPARQTGGQRLYSDQDVALLARVVELTREGLSVGEVATLTPKELFPRSKLVLGKTDEEFRRLPLRELAGGEAERMRRLDSLLPELPPRRSQRRYAGEGLDVSLRSLVPTQSATVQRLYHVLKGLYELWTYMEYEPTGDLVRRKLELLKDPQLIAEIERLKAGNGSGNLILEAALHDGSHGALSLLAEALTQNELEQTSSESLALLISLARDQAKILRNAFVDLDPALREADEQLKAHAAEPILSKIEHLQQMGLVTNVYANFQGYITCRCLETSCLDRLIYRCLDLCGINSSSKLFVTIRPSGWVRWTFEVEASAETPLSHHAFAVHLMTKVAARTASSVLSQGYLGARREAGVDTLWFHWPNYQPRPETPRCRCHPLA